MSTSSSTIRSLPDPEGMINQGQGNSAARAIQVYEGEPIKKRALLNLFKAVIANNRAGGWRRLRRGPHQRVGQNSILGSASALTTGSTTIGLALLQRQGRRVGRRAGTCEQQQAGAVRIVSEHYGGRLLVTTRSPVSCKPLVSELLVIQN